VDYDFHSNSKMWLKMLNDYLETNKVNQKFYKLPKCNKYNYYHVYLCYLALRFGKTEQTDNSYLYANPATWIHSMGKCTSEELREEALGVVMGVVYGQHDTKPKDAFKAIVEFLVGDKEVSGAAPEKTPTPTHEKKTTGPSFLLKAAGGSTSKGDVVVMNGKSDVPGTVAPDGMPVAGSGKVAQMAKTVGLLFPGAQKNGSDGKSSGTVVAKETQDTKKANDDSNKNADVADQGGKSGEGKSGSEGSTAQQKSGQINNDKEDANNDSKQEKATQKQAVPDSLLAQITKGLNLKQTESSPKQKETKDDSNQKTATPNIQTSKTASIKDQKAKSSSKPSIRGQKAKSSSQSSKIDPLILASMNIPNRV